MLWSKLELMISGPRTPNPVSPSQAGQWQLFVPPAGCVSQSAKENLASESKFSSHVMAAAISSPHSLPLPWKDTETLSWGITCWRQKWHFWDTSHRGSWGVLILLRQSWWQCRESVFVHVRCHNARLWAEKLLVEKQPHPGVLLQERLWRQDLIFNYLRHQNGNHKYLQEDFFLKKTHKKNIKYWSEPHSSSVHSIQCLLL